MDLEACNIRQLTRGELDTVIAWASAEGWNPGLHDAAIFWETDPEGFVGVELAGELIAAGSIVAYGDEFGFMGCFIVKSELRGQKIGTKLWFHRRDLLCSRLSACAAIGMDGVFDMQAWYATGGFVLSHRNLRMEGIARSGAASEELQALSECEFESVARYDQQHFGFERKRFLRRWIQPTEGAALGCVRGGQFVGYGVVRKCVQGYKVGPLFADDALIAKDLFIGLSQSAVGETMVLDVPENNLEALKLAATFGLKEVFGCARMYYGPAPDLPWSRIFGITSFELG